MNATPRIYLIKRKRKLPSGRSISVWNLRWYATDGKTCSESVGACDEVTKKDAEQARRDKEVAMGCGKIRRDKPRRITLAEFFAMDRQTIAGDVRGSTLMEHDLASAKAIASLGADFLIADVGWREVGRIKQYMVEPPPLPPQAPGQRVKRQRKPARPATIRKTLSNLRGAFNRALKQGLVNTNPFAELRMPRVESKVKRIFTRIEVERMIGASEDGWWQMFIRLAATSGLRLNELLNLRWSDIDLEKGTITVQRKTAETFQHGGRTFQTWEWSAKARSSYRTVPVPSETLEELKKQRLRQGASPFVFIDLERLAALQRRVVKGQLPPKVELIPNLLRDFTVIQRHAANGTEWVMGCIHDLRRTYCTWLAAAGVPMNDLRQYAGHSDISTTANFYCGTTESMADRVRNALSATA